MVVGKWTAGEVAFAPTISQDGLLTKIRGKSPLRWQCMVGLTLGKTHAKEPKADIRRPLRVHARMRVLPNVPAEPNFVRL